MRLRTRPSRLASKARFVAVSGSSGKSTTTALIAHILGAHGSVHAHVYSNTAKTILPAIRKADPDLDFFVTEAGVGAKGDMDPTAKGVRPDVAVITLVAIEHYSSFKTKEAIAQEKGKLVEAVQPGGFAVLNADDENVMAMAERTGERVVTFGRENEADYRVLSATSRFPGPLHLRIAWRGNVTEITIPLIGEHFWVPVAAAFATAVELGVDAETIVQRLSGFRPLPRRCEPVVTERGPVFILDTIKAPWHSLQLALNVMETVQAPRKRIVIGQMSDLTSSDRKYRDAYRAAREVCDQVIFVGEHSHRSKASAEDRETGRFVEKTRVQDAYAYIRETAIENEVILLKSSPKLHLERIALAWNNDVRCWADRCGHMFSCHDCGLYDRPYDEHKGVRPDR